MNDVLVVELTVSREVAEVLADWLWLNGASAVVETEAPESLFPDVVALTADLPAGLVASMLDDELTDPALEYVLSARVVGGPDDDRKAGATWRDFAQPVICGRVEIVPQWLDPDSDDAVEGSVATERIRLVMEPGEAFGAGTHVTTRLCLEAVGDVIHGDETVLDFGCGTGVLGVAAAMVGARDVTAVDIDPEAIRVTRQLAVLNGVGGSVTAIAAVPVAAAPVADESALGVFDVVFANVLIDVFEAEGARIAATVAVGGLLVISGLLVDQRDRAVAALGGPSRFTVEDEIERDGWVRLVLRGTE